MPGRILQADVDEVKARTNIADIIGERVALKSAGIGAMKGLCPFHDERSPSFNVRPQAGFYHCFGCNESGDVYSFLRAMDHVSFTEAVERLAGRIGYTLHYEDGGAAPETTGRARMYAANGAAAEFFRAQLATAEAESARRFLGERGFDAGAAAHFGVGYAPKGWSNLRDALHAQGFSDEELSAAGLVSQGQRGVYDRFRGRAIWPIRDVTSQVIGFGARKLYDDDQGPKYLNTPETPVYRKSQVLYGLDLAKRDISRDHRVVVVEGYTDVMACHLAGITTAIASCGTAFGSDHISVLRRVMGDDSASGEVVFTFDPDAAGQKAALRAFGDEKRFAAQTYVAVAPEGLDPCDLRLTRGDAAVRALMETKVPMFEFVIDQRLSGFALSTVEGRAGALRAAAPIVAEIRDPSLRPGYVRVLARRLGLEMSEVRAAVDRASRASTSRSADDPATTPTADQVGTDPLVRVTIASLPRSADIERQVLMGFLQFGHRLDPELVERAVRIPFQHPALDAVRQSIVGADMSRPGWAMDAVTSVREPYRSLGAELLTAAFPARDDEHAIASATDLARRIVTRDLDREKVELRGAIQRVAPDSEEGRALSVRMRDLETERRRLLGDQ
ncbi:DNA primase [Microbacterium sp. cf046]|uniref:DNA primase n=1 Tax=Microbacterium sp. cf046 TaxID=1761803 RepID=UPI0008F2FE72|nr:DNA primase [Microbacterium sp. cf046]SFS05368.1 DNA primase [Microbacterium sp. cf046]